MFNRQEQFFQSTVFNYFTKAVAAFHSSVGIVLFSKALAAINCLYTMYLTDISIYCYLKVALAAIYLRGSIIMSGGHLQ